MRFLSQALVAISSVQEEGLGQTDVVCRRVKGMTGAAPSLRRQEGVRVHIVIGAETVWLDEPRFGVLRFWFK